MCDGGRLNSHVRPKRNGRTFPPPRSEGQGVGRGWGRVHGRWTTHTPARKRSISRGSSEGVRLHSSFTACSQPVKLSQQRLLAAWGSQDKLDQQTQKCENGCREFEWPSTGIHDTHGMT